MINNTIDFDYAINKIKEATNPTIYLQGDILNSEHMNNTFREIERTLNTLYEKTRYLEDSIAYTKSFLETKINYFSSDIESILQSIENEADSSKNLSYISYPVTFKKNAKVLQDRNRTTELHPLTIKDKKLTLDYKIDKNQEYSLWNRTSEYIPYKDNISAVKEEPYRAIYLEEKLVPGGLSETIYVALPEPTVINSLDLKPVNCDVKNLKFGLINGIEEYVGDYTVDMPINSRVCTYIKFDLVCHNYDLNEYTLDRELVSEDIWSLAQEFEYSQIANVTTKFDASVFISKAITNSQTGKKTTVAFGPKNNKATSTLKMFSYVFGIDSFAIKNSEYNTDGYMISDAINIGHLKEGEYIRLDVSHQRNECCEISYSILDGDVEVPISIMEEEWIENELMFGDVDTRFEMDYDSGYSYEGEIIKKNGAVVEMSFVDAKMNAANNIDRYSVSYKSSADFYDYKPLNNTIKIKCYIRTFGKINNAPYISNITVRKYGEESLWINRH